MTRDRPLGGQPQLGLDHPGALAKLALRRLVRRRLDLLLEPAQLLAERTEAPNPAVDDDRLEREIAQEAHPILVILGDPFLDRLDRRILSGPVTRRLELAELPVQATDLREDVLDPAELALRELGPVERLQVLVGLDLALPQLLGQVHELAPDHRDRHDHPADPLLAALDLLSEPHFLLGVQKMDATDLAEIEADGILRAAEALLGRLLVLLGGPVGAPVVLVRRLRQGLLGLTRDGQVESVKDLFHLVRGDKLPWRRAHSFLGLGLSNSGHGHRGATVLHGTTLEHRSPFSGPDTTLWPRYDVMSRVRPTYAHYETYEPPGKFPRGPLFHRLAPLFM